jgi:hypothetical protein
MQNDFERTGRNLVDCQVIITSTSIESTTSHSFSNHLNFIEILNETQNIHVD